MSNLIAFNSVFERAMRVESNRESLNESLTIVVPTPVILFAKSHIDLLEEQLQYERDKIKAMQSIASGAGYVFDMATVKFIASLDK